MTRTSAAVLVLSCIVLVTVSAGTQKLQAQAQQKPGQAAPAKPGGMAMSGASKMTDAQKIASAMSAAPADSSKGVTIVPVSPTNAATMK